MNLEQVQRLKQGQESDHGSHGSCVFPVRDLLLDGKPATAPCTRQLYSVFFFYYYFILFIYLFILFLPVERFCALAHGAGKWSLMHVFSFSTTLEKGLLVPKKSKLLPLCINLLQCAVHPW